MVIRLFLFATSLASFLYFLFPSSFDSFKPKENDVLGISKVNAAVNISTVQTALIMYCVSEEDLPNTLNDLYEGYLVDKIKIDLDKLFTYEIVDKGGCEYDLGFR